MNFIHHSFRHADVILREPQFIDQYNEVINIVRGITEDDLMTKHYSWGECTEETPKSLSRAINELLKERFIAHNWHHESAIFQDTSYQGETWRLDFAKNDISIEVAFNHSTVIAWNLTKPVLASELNHVQKAIQTKIGVIITATEALKRNGGFDNAVGTYEKFLDYLPPMMNLLTVPLLIIGLTAPTTFIIDEVQLAPRKKIGVIRLLP